MGGNLSMTYPLARIWGVLLVIALLSGCATRRVIRAGQSLMTMDQFETDLITLSSDEFQGRKPGTPGGEMTTAYLVRRFQELGLEPGNGQSYLQEVPLVSTTPDLQSALKISGMETTRDLEFGNDFVGRTSVDRVVFDSAELVFVGFGAVAPEYDWDDYRDIDVAGKLVIILRNDPGYASGDTTLFNGTGNSPHSLFTAKYRQAGEHGALGALVIIDPGLVSGSSNWRQFRRRGIRPGVQLDLDDEDVQLLEMDGYLNLGTGRSLLKQAGLDYDSLVTAAAQPGFKGIPLGLYATGLVSVAIHHFVSYNVLGRLAGSQRPDETVIYTAHWDHDGIDTTLVGDQIHNGASDNATGLASILTLAESFARLEQRPDRSMLFMAVTAEESGLLGSRYYVNHPIYPLTKTAAVINIDMLIPIGRTWDVIIVGYGKSELETYVTRAARRLGMEAVPDPQPEQNFYLRSDHINFARAGVPALDLSLGIDSRAHGVDWGRARVKEFLDSTYHTIEDEFDPAWDLSGIRDYLHIVFDVGYTIGHQTGYPNWYPGDAFRSVRDAAMEEAALAD